MKVIQSLKIVSKRKSEPLIVHRDRRNSKGKLDLKKNSNNENDIKYFIVYLKRLRIAQEIQREQEEIEVKLKDLEARGVLIEKELRGEGQNLEE